MERPIEVDLPHRLGREEARRRIATNIHKLEEHIPGGTARVDARWAGDVLDLKVEAMGQSVDTVIAVEDSVVRVRVKLPGFLAMLARPIELALQRKGDLLLEDRRDD